MFVYVVRKQKRVCFGKALNEAIGCIIHQTNGCITIQTARANIGNSQIKLPTTPYTFCIVFSEE